MGDVATALISVAIGAPIIFLVFFYPHPLCEKVVSMGGGFTMIIIAIIIIIIVSYYQKKVVQKKLEKLD